MFCYVSHKTIKSSQLLGTTRIMVLSCHENGTKLPLRALFWYHFGRAGSEGFELTFWGASGAWFLKDVFNEMLLLVISRFETNDLRPWPQIASFGAGEMVPAIAILPTIAIVPNIAIVPTIVHTSNISYQLSAISYLSSIIRHRAKLRADSW